MKIACRSPIINFLGEVINHPDGKAATFRTIALDCLTMRQPKDGEPGAAYRCFSLGRTIQETDFIDLSVEDCAFLKERMALSGQLFNNLVIGRMWDFLEGKVAPEPIEEPADRVVSINKKSAE